MGITAQKSTDRYVAVNGDCLEYLPALADGSVHLSIYSPPFGGLYHYSSSERDLSNARTYEEFLEHYEFVVQQIARVTMPGRISAVHATDIAKDGANYCGFFDLPGDIIRLHEKHGFEAKPRICIWKEPLEVRNRTMMKSLMHRTAVEDSTLTTVAPSDYLLPFVRLGRNPVPVTHETGFDRYVGEREVPSELIRYRNHPGKQTENRYSHWIWRRYASGVWDDVRLDHVLPYLESREEGDEKHVHPLQLDVIERAVVLWSNPDETVLTPFMGVGSEVYGSIINGRRGIGIELKESYYRQALRNLEAAVGSMSHAADLRGRQPNGDLPGQTRLSFADEPAEVTL